MAILLPVVVIIALIWTVTLERIRHEREQAIGAEVTKNSNLALAHEERTARALQVFDQMLLVLRNDLALNGSALDLNQRLDAAQIDRSYLHVVSLIGRDGGVIATSLENLQAGGPANFSDRDYFTTHAGDARDRLHIGPPILGRVTGKWGISLTRRLSAADGSFAGVAYMSVDPAYFASVYQKAEQSPQGAMALIGLDGITRARRNNGKVSFGEDIRASQLFKELPKSRNGHYTAVAASDGQLRTASYRQLEDHPLVVLVASSLDNVLAAPKERASVYHGAAAVATLLVLVAAALLRLATQRRASALTSIENSERRYRLLFENSLDAVMSVTSGGRVLAANAAACRLFGLTEQELRETDHRRLAAEDPRLQALLKQRQDTGRAQGCLTMLRGDDTPFEAEISASLYTDSDGRELSSVIVRDMTERQRADKERLQLETQLRESHKMESIGTLAGGIAHDFNNILAAILSNVAMVRQDLGEAHPSAPSLGRISQAALRARALVQQILTFSRRQPEQHRSLLLRPLVEEALSLLRATLPATVRLVVRLSDEPLRVVTDATQMQQIVMNLCANAWQALKDQKGTIWIDLEAVMVDGTGPADPAGLNPGRHVLLRVRDDGCGIDGATRARIFEPFFTTKPVGEGTGLGLSVVHGIVASHGGAIVLDSVPGRGSSFGIYLPLAPCEPELTADPDSLFTERPPASAVRDLRGRGQHLLYIDDDEVLALTVDSLLQRLGYRVTCQGSPRQALALVQEDPLAFDLVITDFNMPEFSGIEVAEKLRQWRPELPVIITSGFVSEDLQSRARQAGVRRVMLKEYTLEQLGGLVHELLEESEAQATL